MCITVIYIHTCVGLKHYDKFFKYPNSLFIMKYDLCSSFTPTQSSYLCSQLALTFSRACRCPHPSNPPSTFSSSIAQIRLFTLGHSPMVCVGPPAPSLRHTSIDMPLQPGVPTTNTSFPSSLLTVHASLPPLFSSISHSHTPSPSIQYDSHTTSQMHPSLSILLPVPHLLLTHTCMYTDRSPNIYLGRL